MSTLPSGWQTAREVSTGKVYYFNSKTKETCPSVNDIPPPLPPQWRATIDAKGQQYYWHVLSRETRYERPTADNADTSLPGVMKVMRKSSVGRVLLSAIHDHEITAAEVPAHERRSLFMDTDEEDPHVTSAMQSAMEVSASTPARAPGGLLLPDGSCPIGLTEGEAIELKALRSSVLGAANNSSAGTPGGRSMSSIDDVMTADLDDAKP